VFSTQEQMTYELDADPTWNCDRLIGCSMAFDGTVDFVERDDDGTFDPVNNSGSFSVGVRLKTKDVTQANQWVFTKGTDWYLHLSSGNDVALNWTDATGTGDAVSVGNFISDNEWFSAAASYGFNGDTTSNATMRANNEVEGSIVDGEGPVRNNAYPLGVGARADNSSNELYGSVALACYWNRELAALERNQFNNPFFGNTTLGDGFSVDFCSQSATHAVCSPQTCVEWSRHSCWPDQNYLPEFGQYTELLENNSFETYTGTQGNPTFDDMSVQICNSGDGTCFITAHYSDSKYGDVSVKMEKTGTTSTGYIRSACQTTGIGNDVYGYFAIKVLSGNPYMAVRMQQFDNANCTAALATTNLSFGVTTNHSWKDYGGLFAAGLWNGSTSSYNIEVVLKNTTVGPASVLIDNMSGKEASYHTPWVHAPAGGGAVTYVARRYELHNPLLQENGGVANWEGGFCLGGWLYSDWDGTNTSYRYIFSAPGDAGNDNRWFVTTSANGLWVIHDAAGVSKSRVLALDATNWSAGWKYVEACTDNTGTRAARHYNSANDTWYDWSGDSGGGTGIQDDADTRYQIGNSSGGSCADAYFWNNKVGPYKAIWPMYGWGNGRPPSAPVY